MHLIISLAILGFIIMGALALANFAIMVVIAGITLPVAGITALVGWLKKRIKPDML